MELALRFAIRRNDMAPSREELFFVGAENISSAKRVVTQWGKTLGWSKG
jgi:hypothetical protein